MPLMLLLKTGYRELKRGENKIFSVVLLDTLTSLPYILLRAKNGDICMYCLMGEVKNFDCDKSFVTT